MHYSSCMVAQRLVLPDTNVIELSSGFTCGRRGPAKMWHVESTRWVLLSITICASMHVCIHDEGLQQNEDG